MLLLSFIYFGADFRDIHSLCQQTSLSFIAMKLSVWLCSL